MPELANLVRVTSTTSGTGTLTLGGAVTGFLTPSQAGMVDGHVYAYAIEADYVTVGDDSVPTSREVGHGTYASGAGTLTRTVVNSTNSNALLNLAGDEQVIISFTSETYNIARISAENNLIINGGIEIDQEFAGAAHASVAAGYTYAVDEFVWNSAGAVVVTTQQVADAPSGFKYSLKISVTTADNSVGAADGASIIIPVEGYRTARLGFGAAGAASVSLGFWVKVHRTGTYTGAIQNASSNRAYIFEYTVSTADTWEYHTVIIPGDTSGTWATATSAGFVIFLNLMVGSNFQSAAGSWTGANVFGTSNQVNGVAATSDTFQITGVSLISGTVPVPQDMSPQMIRSFNEELGLSQHYYRRWTYGGGGSESFFWGSGHAYNTTGAEGITFSYAPMRAVPAMSYSAVGDFRMVVESGTGATLGTLTLYGGIDNITWTGTRGSGTHTAGQGAVFNPVTTGAWIAADARL